LKIFLHLNPVLPHLVILFVNESLDLNYELLLTPIILKQFDLQVEYFMLL